MGRAETIYKDLTGLDSTKHYLFTFNFAGVSNFQSDYDCAIVVNLGSNTLYQSDIKIGASPFFQYTEASRIYQPNSGTTRLTFTFGCYESYNDPVGPGVAIDDVFLTAYNAPCSLVDNAPADK